jgi:DNA-binding PadR family transcriptional regulator
MQLPGGRARRGEVPVAVMALLKEQDMHGYQMIQEIAERSGGAWNPSPGSIYPALQLLEEQGMIVSADTGGKRVFSLTEIGRKHADMLPAEAPWTGMAEESGAGPLLREAFQGLTVAATQVSRGGDDDQIRRTADILTEARRRIYSMLAGE